MLIQLLEFDQPSPLIIDVTEMLKNHLQSRLFSLLFVFTWLLTQAGM
jgi:hypothetical protein